MSEASLPRLRAQSGQTLWRLGVWAAASVVLAVLPMIFSSPVSVTILNQMGISIVFALSYNMLLGLGGMLSFGHAV